MPKVLIVEDDKIVSKSLVSLLTKADYNATCVSDGPEALEIIKKEQFDAIILDINLPSMSGLDVLGNLRQIPEAPPVIMLTAHGSVQNAIAALKAGAIDFLIKPCPPKELKMVLANVISHHNKPFGTQAQIGPYSNGLGAIVGDSQKMKEVMALVKKVAPTDSNVFICGETGTGKNLIAYAIHQASHRKDKPLVKIDCAVLPSELLESELFGHEPGSFTGAKDRFIGKFEQADGGTVFLDEISNLTLAAQAKLLGIIQEREFSRIGGTGKIKVNIRIISASNKDLKQLITEGKFREDLLYRLEVVSITMPPLSEHKEDIPALCEYILKKFNAINRTNIKGIDSEAIEALMNYRFPGNIRELENLIEQLTVTIDSDTIKLKDLPSKVTQFPVIVLAAKTPQVYPPNVVSLAQSSKASESDAIMNALRQANGNKKKAAEILGISRVTLYNKIKEHGLSV